MSISYFVPVTVKTSFEYTDYCSLNHLIGKLISLHVSYKWMFNNLI